MFYLREMISRQYLSNLIKKDIYTVVETTDNKKKAKGFLNHEEATTALRRECLSRNFEVVEE